MQEEQAQARWTLALLADQLVALQVVHSMAKERVCQTLRGSLRVMSGCTQVVQHAVNCSNPEPSFGGGRQPLTVLAQASISAQLSKGPLHNPAFGLDLKAPTVGGWSDDDQGPMHPRRNPIRQLGGPDNLGLPKRSTRGRHS